MKVAIDIEPFERKLLAYLFALYGNRTKTKIRHAWESGDYSKMRLGENDESTLQAMRNTRGPSWLVALKLSSL